jgi:predicted ATP-grasp superfamily ATP-dependent carboligase
LRIAVFEFLCSSGAYSDSGPAGPYAALLDEGAAMLLSLASDLAGCRHEVSIALEPSIHEAWKNHHFKSAALKHLEVHPITPCENPSIEQIAQQWRNAYQNSDCAIVIAPELDGLLPGITQAMRDQGCRIIAPEAPFIQCASDKWETYQAWLDHKQITAPTLLASQWIEHPDSLDSHPFESHGWVLKRRCTAGSTDMQRFASKDQLLKHLSCMQDLQVWIVQPWISGKPASLAVVGDSNENLKLPCVIGPTEQLFDPRTGSYIGGQGPLLADPTRLKSFAKNLLDAIPGKPAGWVGIDFLIQADDLWIPLEINARLTSSYLGYRIHYGQNLANAVLGMPVLTEQPLDPLNPMTFRFSVNDFRG